MSIADKLNTIAENQEKVFDAGKTKEYQEFWNTYIEDDHRYSMSYRFAGSGWKETNFRPNKNIEAAGCSSMFMYSAIEVDLVEHLEKLGITISFANCVSSTDIFNSSKFIRIGELDFRNMTGLSRIFNGCSKLITIDKIMLKNDGSQTITNLFNNCSALKNISFDGVIGASISFAQSPLSKESIENVVEHLSDNLSGGTVTFNKSAKESAFTIEEWNTLIATKPNWTFSLA